MKNESTYLNKKMYSVQNRIYCGVGSKSYIPKNYNQLKSQGHGNEVLKNEFTKSMIRKTQYMKNK